MDYTLQSGISRAFLLIYPVFTLWKLVFTLWKLVFSATNFSLYLSPSLSWVPAVADQWLQPQQSTTLDLWGVCSTYLHASSPHKLFSFVFAGSGVLCARLFLCHSCCLPLHSTLPPQRLLSDMLMIGGCAVRIYSFTDHTIRITSI